MICFSLLEGGMANDPKSLVYEPGLFRTGKVFNVTATLVMVILLILYIVFW
jgi:hypothetical protein